MIEYAKLEDPFVEVYRAANHAELIAIRLQLDALKVRYYVKNEFASLGSLSAIGENELSVMVEASRAAECRRAIQGIVTRTP
ncbi:MAG: DUF2007 domain-containing protein [Gemmatimonadota bacterium]|nr:MAG: DUF2007 domain-containing protein [Gemmatimonadota bacterium]